MGATVVIAGVGPGLGASLARKFAGEGCRVGLFARSAEYLEQLASDIRARNQEALGVPVDITDPEQVAEGYARVRDHFGEVDILINHGGSAAWKGLQEITPQEFEEGWRSVAYGGFLCAREAVPAMTARGAGSIIFTGATSSVRGRGGAVAFSSAKFAVRGLAQALAHELWPKGIHVAHVIVDGVIDTPTVRERLAPASDEPLLEPDAIAESYWNLVTQERQAWTLELDLRPFNEEFFV